MWVMAPGARNENRSLTDPVTGRCRCRSLFCCAVERGGSRCDDGHGRPQTGGDNRKELRTPNGPNCLGKNGEQVRKAKVRADEDLTCSLEHLRRQGIHGESMFNFHRPTQGGLGICLTAGPSLTVFQELVYRLEAPTN